jgi:multiple sugar transport system permease protein
VTSPGARARAARGVSLPGAEPLARPRVRAHGGRLLWPALFLAPWLVGVVGLYLVPMGLSLYYSFTNYDIVSSPAWLGLFNYKQMFSDPQFWLSAGNTLYLLVVMVPVSMLAALLFAVLLAQPVRGMHFFRTVLYLPSLMPPVAAALLWLWLLNPEYGLVNTLLSVFGITGPPWLATPAWSKPALVLMSVWGSGGAMVIFLAGLKGVSQELLDAARIDGAGALRRFVHVTLPSISPLVLFNLVMAVIGVLQYFTQAFVMGGGEGAGASIGPGGSLQFLTVYLFELAFENLRTGYAAALSWVIFVFSAALTVLIFASARRWVHYTFWR